MHSQQHRGSTRQGYLYEVNRAQKSVTSHPVHLRLCRHASLQGYVGLGPLLGWGGTFIGVHSLVTLAQVIGEHSVVCCSHSNLIHRLWVVLGAAHIGLDVNLSHRVGLVCGPYLHRQAAACQPSPHQCIRVGQKQRELLLSPGTVAWQKCPVDRRLQRDLLHFPGIVAWQKRGRSVQGSAVWPNRLHVCQTKVKCPAMQFLQQIEHELRRLVSSTVHLQKQQRLKQYLDHAIIRARHEQHGVSVAEVHAPNTLLVRLILGHILPSGNVPHVHHPLIVTAGQVCLQVLVPGQAAELGACDQLLTGAVSFCCRVGHDGTVLVQADAL